MGGFTRLMALAGLAGLALAAAGCGGDKPAGQRVPERAPAAAKTACLSNGQLCERPADTAISSGGVCLSLILNRTPEYAVCWPGRASGAGSSWGRSGKLLLAAFRDGSLPCAGSSCGLHYHCICVHAGGEAPAFALTFALPHPPGIHATGCLILGTPPAAASHALAASPIVTLRL